VTSVEARKHKEEARGNPSCGSKLRRGVTCNGGRFHEKEKQTARPGATWYRKKKTRVKEAEGKRGELNRIQVIGKEGERQAGCLNRK